MGHDFIERFRDLHERRRKGVLSTAEQADYEQQRGELGRLLLIAQQLNHGGKTLRAALRTAQMFKVEIAFGAEKPQRTSTIDVASGGFAALLSSHQALQRLASFTLHLPKYGGGSLPVEGTAKVASSRAQGGLFRVSFTFQDVSDAGREEIEMVIIDTILARARQL